MASQTLCRLTNTTLLLPWLGRVITTDSPSLAHSSLFFLFRHLCSSTPVPNRCCIPSHPLQAPYNNPCPDTCKNGSLLAYSAQHRQMVNKQHCICSRATHDSLAATSKLPAARLQLLWGPPSQHRHLIHTTAVICQACCTLHPPTVNQNCLAHALS